MSLIPGTRIGVYEITAQIGVGGMGEVYRATDSNLKRSVAIKVLPASVAGDADRLARFQREAEVLAALNHPNIAAIYGLEKTPDFTALVMELVEGDDLSQRIAMGAIPIDEALPIAKQIAEALEAAHEQGIIHRDLKPANIKVRTDGTVKVLDFGLAKALDRSGESGGSGRPGRAAGVNRPDSPDQPDRPDLSASPTLTSPAMTQAGMILGTAAYMAPEQAKGRTVDRRADIWAFGVVLYEMLTGHRAFGGEDVSDTLANVLKTDPAWERLPADVPARIRQVLRSCLQREAKQRLGDMQSVRLALEGAFETAAPHAAVSVSQPVSVWSRALPWAVAGAALLVAGATALLGTPWLAEKPADRPLVRLDVDLGADVSLPAPSSSGSSVAISPDGARLVYASGSPARLFIRRLDQPNAVELPGTQGARVPFFSPDSQWVGFVSGGKANKTSVEGGAVVPLADLSGVTFADWGADGSIFMWASQKLLRIPAGGGPTETVAEPRAGELGMYGSQLLPGGKAVLLTVDNPGPIDRNTIDVVTLADHQRKTVLRGAASARYLASPNGAGHLVYVTQATLFAIPFDLNTLATRGTAVPVVDDVAYENTTGVGQFEVSRTGTLVYRRAIAGAAALRTLQWVDIEGKKEPLRATPATYQELKLSPDGKRIALSVIDGASEDVWVYDPQRDAMTRLTSGGEAYRYPVWSPDGQHVVFAWVGHGMFQTRADGASQPLALTASTAVQYPWSFSSDGTRLAYHELARTRQLWTLPLQDEGGQLKAGTPEPFLKSGSNDVAPSFSPDGRWLAYQSNESGTPEVYVRAFSSPSAPSPGSAGKGGPSTSLRTGKWQISNAGGTQPRWSRGGHDLIYQSGDQLMAASYNASGDTFVAERPRLWMAKIGAGENGFGDAAWDLAPDGKRVIVAVPVESSEAPKQEHEVVFLQNFVDELRRRVPVGK